jgi:hypothetical protein
MNNPNDERDRQGGEEERGYQPPARPPRADVDPQKVETGYVPPSRPVDKEKKK